MSTTEKKKKKGTMPELTDPYKKKNKSSPKYFPLYTKSTTCHSREPKVTLNPIAPRSEDPRSNNVAYYIGTSRRRFPYIVKEGRRSLPSPSHITKSFWPNIAVKREWRGFIIQDTRLNTEIGRSSSDWFFFSTCHTLELPSEIWSIIRVVLLMFFFSFYTKAVSMAKTM